MFNGPLDLCIDRSIEEEKPASLTRVNCIFFMMSLAVYQNNVPRPGSPTIAGDRVCSKTRGKVWWRGIRGLAARG